MFWYILKYCLRTVEKDFSEFKTLFLFKSLKYFLTGIMELNYTYLIVLLWQVIKTVYNESLSQNVGYGRCSKYGSLIAFMPCIQCGKVINMETSENFSSGILKPVYKWTNKPNVVS